MLNRVIIQGRFTKDVELRRTQSGTAVASFTLACERDFKGQSGERETDFIDCQAWRGTAEFVSKYFSKGRMAVVEGWLQVRSWTDSNGNKRHATEIVADNVYFSDSKRDDNQQPPTMTAEDQAENRQNLADRVNDGFAEVNAEDGDLPF